MNKLSRVSILIFRLLNVFVILKAKPKEELFNITINNLLKREDN